MSFSGADASDQQLVDRVRAGDTNAFNFLVLRYQNRVAALVARFIKDHQEVEDVTQEAFIKAYRALHLFRGESAFYTWLYRIAVNTAKNSLVARGRRPPTSDLDAGEAELVEIGRRCVIKRRRREVLRRQRSKWPSRRQLRSSQRICAPRSRCANFQV